MTTLSVVIPAYNEERGIADIARRVLAVRPDLLSAGVDDLEVLVVDDGSADATAAIAESLAGIRLVRHPHNRGYGAALKTGFRTARGELIGFLDADGTYPPEWFRLCRAASTAPSW
jgi:glycosyltransferase involved in cell wall biosynthesis